MPTTQFQSIEEMPAVVMQTSGLPAKSLTVRSEPVREPGPGEVLVEVHAAAVNPLDVANVLGFLGTPLPMIPGGDFAGIVVSEGDYVGQEVWGSGPALGMALGKARPGTHAQFVVLPETWLSRKPERLSMPEAAAVGRSHWAPWEALINMMGILPGETILITGGSGLVGQAAAAIARWRGAEPIIADLRKPEGAEQFIDTSSSDLSEAVLELTHGRGADLALDTIGGSLFPQVVRSLRFDGRVVGFHGGTEPVEVDLTDLYSRQIHVTGLASVFNDGADVARIFDQLRVLFDRSTLVAPAVKTWPLKNCVEAYETVMNGSAGIKQVLLPMDG